MVNCIMGVCELISEKQIMSSVTRIKHEKHKLRLGLHYSMNKHLKNHKSNGMNSLVKTFVEM